MVHFSEKTFSNIEYINFCDLCHQSTNSTSIEIIIKINLVKTLKLNSMATFFENVVLLGINEFLGLHDDLKII